MQSDEQALCLQIQLVCLGFRYLGLDGLALSRTARKGSVVFIVLRRRMRFRRQAGFGTARNRAHSAHHEALSQAFNENAGVGGLARS